MTTRKVYCSHATNQKISQTNKIFSKFSHTTTIHWDRHRPHKRYSWYCRWLHYL